MDFHLPYLNTAIAGIFSILVLSYMIITRQFRADAWGPNAPKVAGGWPLLGHIHLLAGPVLPHIVLGGLAVKECFTTNDLAVSFQPTTVGIEHLSHNEAMVPFSPYGPYWREIRKIAAPELLSNSRLEMLKHVQVSEVEMSLKPYKLWIKRKEGSGDVLVEMKEWLGDLTLNVVFRMVAGKCYFSVANDSLSNQKEARRCQIAMSNMWLDIGGHEKAMGRTPKELDSIVTGWLEEHKQRRTQGQEQDFMDQMFLAMTWALSLLLNNRHTLVKAQEELDKHVGIERLVNESDISNLVYLQAIFKESLKFGENCTIGGYHVPKDTWLVMNVGKIQTDPRVWADLMEFKPVRFLTTHEDVDVKGHNFEIIPFGGGRTACPGMGFAIHVIQLGLASFLHAFDISTPENAAVDMTGSLGLSNVKSIPLQVLVKPRLSPTVYEYNAH
ncbi:cytochrome P450 CYP82D47-like [Pyrus ussuriensis x Pyrus communis]|uniref:Cytochrome P450 CYP82D47-like n=1 Tax=Pyrus ussuriensis x Pyrus communis TaxID=2448454 RepID=A0A5N5HXC1_9ROSA|nr:cytochrome P450 CYP82D47-like [Pyrus ussuriensis x Pyrus communis]